MNLDHKDKERSKYDAFKNTEAFIHIKILRAARETANSYVKVKVIQGFLIAEGNVDAKKGVGR